MEDLKDHMRDNYIRYASYVILDRAIPHVVDGLKPVQRRILHTLKQMHDGKLHKVANVAGQTMAFHPHGDAAITDALVNMAMKEFLLDMQGNFGNLYTGDPAAAARYIETRLSPLAAETLFNPDLTETVLSYDSRNREPVVLPSKIPVLLMQGAEGIAVGMSTKVLPHNFIELLEAQIAILDGKEYSILPDFPTGGIMDASEYNKGRGKVKLRAKIIVKDDKTLIVKEICHGTTTESLNRSIDEAAKKGKIKIESINDYTADKVEVEIKLPRGRYAKDLIDALYAYTECQVSISPQCLVIKDDLPWDTDVNQVLEFNTAKLRDYLTRELEIEKERLLEKIFQKTLEQIFIENRLYQKIESQTSYEKVHSTIKTSLQSFQKQLSRVPSYEDRERLLSIPIRRISKFDLSKNEEEIAKIHVRLEEIEKDLKNTKKVTIRYIKGLIKKYQKECPRRTQIEQLREIDKKAIATTKMVVAFDPKAGFIGTKVKSDVSFECTNFDKILVMYKDGSYRVMNVPEKEYVDGGIAYASVADKKTVFNVVYRDTRTNFCYAKRFVIKSWILDREYRFVEEKMRLEHLSTAAAPSIELEFKPKPKQKVAKQRAELSEVAIKGVSAKGVRLAPKEVKKVRVVKNGAKQPKESLFD